MSAQPKVRVCTTHFVHSHCVNSRCVHLHTVCMHTQWHCAAVADMVRTSLGPRGMDKMIEDSKGGVLITNDGATILRETKMLHPAAKMLVGLSEAQDIEAGDGTTSVVVIAGSLLCAASELMEKGLHPQAIARGFIKALNMAEGILDNMAVPVDLTDEQALQTAVATSLQSKVVSSLANSLAPIAVNAMLQIVKPGNVQTLLCVCQPCVCACNNTCVCACNHTYVCELQELIMWT